MAEKFCFVQYHNFNELNRLPSEEKYIYNLDDGQSCVESRKKESLKTKGTKVYLIVGIKQAQHKKKDFFLWDYSQIEDVCINDSQNGLVYLLKGKDVLCKKPIHLNDLPGFGHFAKYSMGSFAYGLQNVINDPFCEYLTDESNFDLNNVAMTDRLAWLADFENQLDDKSLCLTKRVGQKIEFDCFDFENEERSTAFFRSRYSDIFLQNPKFVIEQFLQLKNSTPTIREVVFPLLECVRDFAIAFSNIKIVVVCPRDLNKIGQELISEFGKIKNIELDLLD